jgi:hypothetical protein
MSFNFYDQMHVPGESYSRRLDRRVAMDEYPYGYEAMEPGAGHVNQGLIDDRYENDVLKRQILPWDYQMSDTTPKVPRTSTEMGSFPDSEVKGAYQAKGRLKGN